MTRKAFEQDDAVALGVAVAVERAIRLGTDGDDRLEGTRGNDMFFLDDGGDDIVFGRGGSDKFVFGGEFSVSDRVLGGRGKDVILLQGRYAETIDLDPEFVSRKSSSVARYLIALKWRTGSRS